MKQALLILVALGLGTTQTSGAVETTFQTNYTLNQPTTDYGSLQNNFGSYANSSGTRISTDDEIAQAIVNLSAQAQQKEDRLAQLAQKLAEQKPAMVAQLEPEKTTISSSSAPAIAAAKASRAAHSRSQGRCARYVRKALQAAGYKFTPNPSAYQYATRGTLAKAGFVKISNSLPSQVGDVVVVSRSAKHRHGHIQIFDGRNWVSDFRQDDINPYSASYPYTTWRDARYYDDASEKGIYLAMVED